MVEVPTTRKRSSRLAIKESVKVEAAQATRRQVQVEEKNLNTRAARLEARQQREEQRKLAEADEAPDDECVSLHVARRPTHISSQNAG